MSKFVSELGGKEKEALKDILSHPGLKPIIEWLLLKKAACPIRAIEEAANMEEVWKYRGELEAYQNIILFLEDAQKSLRNLKEGG